MQNHVFTILNFSGADVNSYTGSIVIGEEEGLSMKYHTNYTHLHCALLEYQPYDLVSMLLETGADVHVVKDGQSLLYDALDHGENMLKLLIKYGCINHNSFSMRHLLQQSDILTRRTSVVQFLLYAGYNLREDLHQNMEVYVDLLDQNNAMENQLCREWVCKPLTLMQSCRIWIRRAIGVRCKPSKFYVLPLPVYLQKYLALETI